MSSTATKQYGVTPPIQSQLPSQEEIAANEALLEELKKQNNFESKEETEKRTKSLQLIQKVTTEFVKHVCKKKNLPQATVNTAGGRIFTYGSFRLGVYGPGSDIDTLVVVPKHVTREDFFEHFPPILHKMAPAGAVEELTPVPDAFVPIIKIELSGISIDLIFARLNLPSVAITMTLKDTSILQGLEERDLRSVNGTRVTDEILELVPQQKTFRIALRGIKLWAQRRAIYANIVGFPGGVAWAMMVARVCQLYPQATGSTVINKFFRIIGQWSWPQPILLKKIEEGPLNARVWNPKIYHGDRYHLMPIITPAYPSMCATHNISMSTKKIITRELMRGVAITDKIWSGSLQWKDLFTKHTFFTQDFKYYLSINAASRTQDAQHVWSGLIESKVRLLVQNLESEGAIELARPFNKGFERVHRCKTEEDVEKVIGGDLSFQASDIKTETTDAVNDPKRNAAAQGDADGLTVKDSEEPADTSNGKESLTMYTTTYYIGIELAQDATKRLDISYQTRTFREICTGWQNYDAELNAISVTHIRNYDLPLDVFGPEEKRPERAAKKKIVKKRPTDGAENATNPDAKKARLQESAAA